jgi:hypothetical protein
MAFDLNQAVRTLGRWYGTKADILAIETAGTGELSRMYVTTDQTETEYYYFVKPNKIDRWRTTGDINTMIAEGQYIKSLSNTEGSVILERSSTGVLSASATLSTDPGQILMKKSDGSLYATAAPNFANGIQDTTGLDMSIVNGKIQGDVKVSGYVDNAYAVLADGGYVQDIRVHTNSQEYMRKNADGTLEVIARPRIQKVDALALADVAAFVAAVNAATFVPTKPLEIGDIVFTAAGNYEYMGNGAMPIQASDLVTVEGDEANTATYRDAITGGDGWDFNKISGIGSTLPSTQANNDVVAGADKRLFVDVDQTTSAAGGSTSSIQQHLINLYNLGGAGIQRAGNGLELGAIVAGETPKVILGGMLEKNTAVAQDGKRFLFTGGAFGIEKGFLQVWDTNAQGYPTGSTGNWAHVFVDGRGDIGVVKLTAGTLPN